jgi:integrase
VSVITFLKGYLGAKEPEPKRRPPTSGRPVRLRAVKTEKPKRKRNLARVDFDFLTRDELDRLLASAEGSARDHAILTVFGYLGLRSNELRMLNVSDIDSESRTLKVLHAKGGKQRLMPLEPVEAALRRWLEERPEHSEALFPTGTSRRISNRYLRTLCKRYGVKAGVGHRIPQGVHPHCLRHTVATLLLQAGVDLRVVQEFLGHSSPAVTALYTHVDLASKRAAINQLFGVAS